MPDRFANGDASNDDPAVSKGLFDRFRSVPIWQPSPIFGALLGDVFRYSLAATMVVTLEPCTHVGKTPPCADAIITRVDMREIVLDIQPQPVITSDNVTVTIDAVIYYYVTDPRSVTYEVANFYAAVSKLAMTNIRNVVGEMTLDESLSGRERINAALTQTLDEATDK